MLGFREGATVTQEEVDDLLAAHDGSVKSAAEVAQEKVDAARDGMRAHVFATVTADQAETWIENNVTDLASAKAALKQLAKAIIYLRDHAQLE